MNLFFKLKTFIFCTTGFHKSLFKAMFSIIPFLLFSIATVQTAVAKEKPQVVVTIAPIHSLVKGVMGKMNEPVLLIDSNVSPHHFSLRPSHIKSLDEADIVIRIGKNFESFLNKPLSQLKSNGQILNIIELSTLELLPYRKTDEHSHHKHSDTTDPHVWLDPDNAREIVKAVIDLLSKTDPANGPIYKKNGQKTLQALQELDEKLKSRLKPITNIPYLVLHDAYYYFEKHYRLNRVAAVTIDPKRRPGARRLSEIRKIAVAKKVRCIFSEPQIPVKYQQIIAKDIGLQTGMLDPIGVELKTDQTLYFKMMEHLAKSLTECLQRKS